MIERDWTVGMEVVFVGYDGFRVTSAKLLEPGGVYTISDMQMSNAGDQVRCADGSIETLGEDALYICVGWPVWYHASAFRPVQKRKTDISQFTAMLTGNRHRVDV